MAFRCIHLLRLVKNTSVLRQAMLGSASMVVPDIKISKPRQFRTEDNLIYLEDPDKFGTLSRKPIQTNTLEDVGDKQEEEFLKNVPMRSQKLTTKQYADLIKEYLKYKRLKEAIEVLEIRMLKEDRVKPENYIYNILIGACADAGYTKKAFKLFNDMKRRALKPTGDTYTCLFEACSNSPWALNGLKNATHLREFMIEKGIEPNLTNYNAMVKAFGRCGDIPMAFKIVDEMCAKKIKIRVHTFNHLIYACISDKQNGLRHALIVWRKMLQMREKPNIYSFNLMLKCVKDCNMGSRDDIVELIGIIQNQIASGMTKMKEIESATSLRSKENEFPALASEKFQCSPPEDRIENCVEPNTTELVNIKNENNNEVISIDNSTVKLELVNKPTELNERRLVPNLLSKNLFMENVYCLQEVNTLQDKFAVVGGQEDFLKEMQVYSLKPDIKTFTQMLPLIPDTTEAEIQLLKHMKEFNVIADIDFYNMLIKKRSLRLDYDSAFQVRKIIKEEIEFRKKRYPNSKNKQLAVNIMTYGVLALACKTKDNAEHLLNEMKEKQLKVNIEILGALLRNGTAHTDFDYVFYIMDTVRVENIPVNPIFLKHLEAFNEKCSYFIKMRDETKQPNLEKFRNLYSMFSSMYTTLLKKINVKEVLKPEHPWQQFRESPPETVQRDNIEIKEPKKFYKRNKKFVRYTPKIV